MSTTVSALSLNLLHHPVGNVIDPDVHPTAITCVTTYDRTLQTANGKTML